MRRRCLTALGGGFVARHRSFAPGRGCCSASASFVSKALHLFEQRFERRRLDENEVGARPASLSDRERTRVSRDDHDWDAGCGAVPAQNLAQRAAVEERHHDFGQDKRGRFHQGLGEGIASIARLDDHKSRSFESVTVERPRIAVGVNNQH
jgi:hypothetical protein